MTIATIIGAVILVAAVLYWLVRAEKKEAHHMDNLHISPPDQGQGHLVFGGWLTSLFQAGR